MIKGREIGACITVHIYKTTGMDLVMQEYRDSLFLNYAFETLDLSSFYNGCGEKSQSTMK